MMLLATLLALVGGMLMPLKRSSAELQTWVNTVYRPASSSDISLAVPAADTQNAGRLARNIGILCARLARLEALGAEISHLAGLDDPEFEFVARDCQQGGDKPAHLKSDLLKSGIDHIDIQMGAMVSILTDRRQSKRSWPSGNPLFGSSTASVTSRFGYRNTVGAAGGGSGAKSFHRGLDLGAPYGSAILAMGSGVVSFSGKNGKFGNLVEIDHGNGFVTRYGHNSENLVPAGSMVRRGQMIARVGSTGRSTGPHVHIEVLSHGKQIDPELLLNLPQQQSG